MRHPCQAKMLVTKKTPMMAISLLKMSGFIRQRSMVDHDIKETPPLEGFRLIVN